MSLIYDSLKKTVATPEPPPVSKIRRQRRLAPLRVLRRALVTLGILGAVMGAGFTLVFWVRSEVERLGPRLQAARTLPPVENASTPPPAPPAAQPPQVDLSLAPPPPPPSPVRTKIGIEDLARPTLELETLFTQKARTNQRVLELERQLHAAWQAQKFAELQALAGQLAGIVGKESAVVQRWQGMLALGQGDYAAAEALFRGLKATGRDDPATRMALAQSLLAQNKIAEARRAVRGLEERAGQDPALRRLLEALGEP